MSDGNQADRVARIRVIAGSGRSGTTWVLDCLSGANGLRPVFEPLQLAVTHVGATYAYRTLLPGARCDEFEEFLCRCDAGTFTSAWTTYRGRMDLMIPNREAFHSLDEFKRTYRR